MNNLLYLFLAYAFIWTALFVFLLSIAARLSRMQREIRQIHELKEIFK